MVMETARVRRGPAWMLALSPLVFAVWLVAVVATMSGTGVGEAADLTPEQMGTIRIGWALMWPLYAAAVLVGSAGMAHVDRALRERGVRGWAVASQVALAVSAAAIVAGLVLSELSIGFDEARLGDAGVYQASLVASYTAIWAGALAVALTGVGLRTSGLLRRTGSTVAVLAVIFVALDAVTFAFPPFVVAFFWTAIGVALLRRRVSSTM